ncbi:hypothetical protein [Oxalobacter formigenes]|uniref:hypothetical protein n=1 Tax=Oxalobacter formigenes TaxID=847 RepID=UPI0012DC4084|nr:hypothetical protein [Oxalobacter formigenes]MCZ4061671.1 hypothetical protein [Oxalobacter formigenes]WAW00951.1 hypothetical protein NB644_08365 [Oxalobacter formigenes]WAW03281.1 hypothetical protein NB642_09145 [Oxalobacter formigenes]WAW06280.1 hypothetical protein NB639_02400 [Oxalobacter formigenes]WAW07340.1 hypothetical protein NB638_07325 [Oxalobacter formigenes]
MNQPYQQRPDHTAGKTVPVPVSASLLAPGMCHCSPVFADNACCCPGFSRMCSPL